MMNNVINSIAKAIVKATTEKAQETQVKNEVKTAHQVRHETEDAIYKAICLIDGTSNVVTWTTEAGTISFRFMWHDTHITGFDNDGIIKLKTSKANIGTFYRSMITGVGSINNELGKRWSFWLLNQFQKNLMTCYTSFATVPPSMMIAGLKLETKDNKVIYNDEGSIMEYDCLGRLCWNNSEKYAWIVDFIKKNFVK